MNKLDGVRGLEFKHNYPGGVIRERFTYAGDTKRSEYPETILNKQDLQKRFNLKQKRQPRFEEISRWKTNDIKGRKVNSYIREVQRQN